MPLIKVKRYVENIHLLLNMRNLTRNNLEYINIIHDYNEFEFLGPCTFIIIIKYQI